MSQAYLEEIEERSLFGEDQAEDDELLKDCYVARKKQGAKRPILIGKWGTGKTAILFHRAFPISDELRKVNEENVWYMDEHSINLKHALELKNHFVSDSYNLSLALQDLWKAEIIRVILLQLGLLYKYYSKPSGAHWKYAVAFSKTEVLRKPIWSSLGIALSIISGTFEQASDKKDEIKTLIGELIDDTAYRVVMKCLNDIPKEKLAPMVAVEPIETPNSPLEAEAGIAQLTISALLNSYKANFTRAKLKKSVVHITIPWHRYRKDDLFFPQKISSYIKHVKWNSNDLREFMNSRIEYEFNKCGRKYTRKNVDPWATLFETKIKNHFCCVSYSEDSFLYVLRHTNHRSRDIQRICRRIVDEAAEHFDIELDDMMLGRGGKKIPDKVIRDVVRDESKDLFEERITEGKRRFNKLADYAYSLQGLKVPFLYSDLKDRMPTEEIPKAINILWESGLLGVQVKPKSEQYALALKHVLGECCYRYYDIDGHSKEFRWFLFDYSFRGKPAELFKRYEHDSDVDVSYVLHPVSFDSLLVDVSQSCPIGA